MSYPQLPEDLIDKMKATKFDDSDADMTALSEVISGIEEFIETPEEKKEPVVPISQQFLKLCTERTEKLESEVPTNVVDNIKKGIEDYLKEFQEDETELNTAVRIDLGGLSVSLAQFSNTLKIFDDEDFKNKYGEWYITLYLSPHSRYEELPDTIEVKNITDFDSGMIEISNMITNQGLIPIVQAVMLAPKELDEEKNDDKY